MFGSTNMPPRSSINIFSPTVTRLMYNTNSLCNGSHTLCRTEYVPKQFRHVYNHPCVLTEQLLTIVSSVAIVMQSTHA